jgi:hypothetical protein
MVCFPNKFAFFSMPSVTLIIIFIVTVGLVVWSLHAHSLQRPQIIMMPASQQQQQQPEVKVNVNTRGGDDRYTRSPEAERVWAAPPDYSRIPGPSTPFNIPTQGIPESYQSMGIVKTGDGKLLPLYGRRSISARDRYNYYTRTDSYNPIPIPVNIKGRDCQDQVGCPELFNGDKVKLSATDEQGEVTIYRVRDIVR